MFVRSDGLWGRGKRLQNDASGGLFVARYLPEIWRWHRHDSGNNGSLVTVEWPMNHKWPLAGLIYALAPGCGAGNSRDDSVEDPVNEGDGSTEGSTPSDGPEDRENSDDHEASGDDNAEQETIGCEQLAQMLVDASILTEDEEIDDLRLTEEFRHVWRRRIDQLRDTDRAILRMALVLELDPDDLSVEERDGEFHAFLRGTEIGRWPSESAFLADLAVRPTLEEWLPLWDDLDDASRGELLARLRVFLEACPVCDGDLVPVEPAPISDTSVELTCSDCGQVTFRGAHP